jgi:tyrosyl-tRNA synthetase
VNTDDRDVERFLKLYSFLPLKEIATVLGLEGQELNAVKSILAYEVTALAHGMENADAAHQAASRVFGTRLLPADLLPSSSVPRSGGGEVKAVPTTDFPEHRLAQGIQAFELLAEVGLCSSKSAARRLIQQGGAYVNDERIGEVDELIGTGHMTKEGILLKAGKKKVHCIRVQS